jgi:tetratricopeptide (TPR) repeat protein
MKSLRFALLFALAAAPAAAAPSQYDACMAQAQSNPGGGLMMAGNWAKKGGGAPADHCAAVALVGLHRFGEAAQKLDVLAKSPFASDPARRSALYDQAGNAWLLGDRPDAAIASFTAALNADPTDPDLLADRARALAMKNNWPKAESDLSMALMVMPDRADLYILRGSARHAMGRIPDARADIDRALRLSPGNADALLERGNMKFESGDAAGARADWQQAASSAPNSPTAQTARQHLADSAPGR